MQTFIVKTVFLEFACLEVLDQHIAEDRHLPDQCLVFVRGNVGGDRALVAVAARVITGLCSELAA